MSVSSIGLRIVSVIESPFSDKYQAVLT
jgi:hypothetical protein